jgi:hypothetical protein
MRGQRSYPRRRAQVMYYDGVLLGTKAPHRCNFDRKDDRCTCGKFKSEA